MTRTHHHVSSNGLIRIGVLVLDLAIWALIIGTFIGIGHAVIPTLWALRSGVL